MLQVLLYAEMGANEGHFTIADVLDQLNNKLIRRHPPRLWRTGLPRRRKPGRSRPQCKGLFKRCPAQLGPDQGSREETRHRFRRRSFAARRRAARHAGPGRSRQTGLQGRKIRLRLAHLARVAAQGGRRDRGVGGRSRIRRPGPQAGGRGRVGRSAVHRGESEPPTLAWMRRWPCAAAIAASRQRFREMELASLQPLEDLSADELEALWAGAKRKLAASEAEARP